MGVRRVTTGHDAQGNSIIVEDSEVEPIEMERAPGALYHCLWDADGATIFDDERRPGRSSTFFPQYGGNRFVMLTIPPRSSKGSSQWSFVEILEEMEEKLPGLTEFHEKNSPGFHKTDTIDFLYIVSGEVWVELDGNEETLLRQGDTLVQNGTRHAWKNKGDTPCCILACIVGAKRV